MVLDKFGREMPFLVPFHDMLIGEYAGKEEGTVLALEQMLYTVRISEYTEPLSYGRHWCYESANEAIPALVQYLSNPNLTEPPNWTRAIDFGEGVKGHDRHDNIRVRRRRVSIDGQAYITTDAAEF